jgi:acyl transferase domain-containing protein
MLRLFFQNAMQRWDIERIYSPDVSNGLTTMSVRLGSFLSDIESFDPGMFR